MRGIAIALAILSVATLFTGCATQAYAALSDFDNGKAVVNVNFGILGPKVNDAQAAATPQALSHCRSLGKTATLVSVRTRHFDPTYSKYVGEYIFLYRCEGADRVTVVSDAQ